MADQSRQSDKQVKSKHSGKRIIATLVLVLVVAGLARSSIGNFSIVEGDSMLPTLRPSDVVHSSNRAGGPQRGDIVIITDNLGERAIKRVIGLPGETVTVYRGYVYIDSRRLNEPYLSPHTYSFESDSRVVRRIDWRVPEQHYFVMGDNRGASVDSRKFGSISRSNIRGIAEVAANAPKPEFTDIYLTPSGTTFLARQ